MPDLTMSREVARINLDNARWEVSHWARVIAEGKASVSEHAAVFIATPETARRYAEAVEAEGAALQAFLHSDPAVTA